jgi:hypothetical protein
MEPIDKKILDNIDDTLDRTAEPLCAFILKEDIPEHGWKKGELVFSNQTMWLNICVSHLKKLQIVAAEFKITVFEPDIIKDEIIKPPDSIKKLKQPKKFHK